MDRRIRLVPNEGEGLVDALNTGIEHVETEFMARMDADDISLPNRFLAQEAVLHSYASVVAVGGLVRYVDDRGEPLARIPWVKQGFPLTASQVLLRLGVENPVFHPTAMIRTTALRAVGGYRNDFPHIEDYELWTRLVRLGEIMNVNEEVLHYRRHSEQVGELQGAAQARMVRALHERLLSTEPAPIDLTYVKRAYLLAGSAPMDEWVVLVAELAQAAREPSVITLVRDDQVSEADIRRINIAGSIGGLVSTTVVSPESAMDATQDTAEALSGDCVIAEMTSSGRLPDPPEVLARLLTTAPVGYTAPGRTSLAKRLLGRLRSTLGTATGGTSHIVVRMANPHSAE